MQKIHTIYIIHSQKSSLFTKDGNPLVTHAGVRRRIGGLVGRVEHMGVQGGAEAAMLAVKGNVLNHIPEYHIRFTIQ
jgi:hypothetical protein